MLDARSEMKKLSVVVIGTGMYVTGRGTDGFGTIMPALLEWQRQTGQLSEVHLVGTNEARSLEANEKVQELQTRMGVNLAVQVYPNTESGQMDYQALLQKADTPPCAIVCVPDHLHYEVTRQCLESNCHSLVVKPLTPTLKEALDLTEIAKSRGLYGMVEFHKRWDKANRLLRDRFQSGELGVPLSSLVEYSQRKIVPSKLFKGWSDKSNIFQYLGVHYVDVLRFVTGAKPKRVMATGQKSWLQAEGIDTYDAIQCMIEWQLDNGVCFNQTLITNWIDPNTSSAMSNQKINLIGSLGRFESDQKNRGLTINCDNKQLEQPNPDFCMPFGKIGATEWQGYGIDSIKSFLSDVCALNENQTSLSKLEKERPTFQEALISTAVVEAANRSLERNSEWVIV